MDLKTHIYNRIGMDGSVNLYIKNSTDLIFNLKNNNDNDFKQISVKELNLGRFYLIKYNYNGNKIWCPIFTLDYKVNKNKNLLYAININYLPITYRILFFNLMFDRFNSYVNENKDIDDVRDQHRFKEISFENIYKLLKGSGSYEFCITAYDIMKIDKLFISSTNIAHRFIMIDTNFINSSNMKEMHDNLINNDYKNEILNIMKEFMALMENYELDSKEYHQRLRAFESKLKIIKG